MKRLIAASFVACVAVLVVCGGAIAKRSPATLAGYKFVDPPREPAGALEIGGSMYQTAAATTTVLGWYQFDTSTGAPTTEGWTAHDVTDQLKEYFHVAGSAVDCDAITPIAGTRSMWCGQWPSNEEPWCGWASLPGYGNNWDQSLATNVGNTVTSVTYTISWDSEPDDDATYVEWWDPEYGMWVEDPSVNGSAGKYTGGGGPLTETLSSPYGATRMRFHFVSDGAGSNEDVFDPAAEKAVKLDNLSINGGAVEDWEDEACNATQSTDGTWVAQASSGFGLYAGLHPASGVVQEDLCFAQASNLWGFFDDPDVTNYACGGWPLQGAMPYGPLGWPSGPYEDLYMNNEIWSPWIPMTGSGNSLILQLLVYRDLPLDNLQFYVWSARTKDVSGSGCPTYWRDDNLVYYGGQKEWYRQRIEIGPYVNTMDTHVQIALGAVDMCRVWCGVFGTGYCHSHAPLVDQVRLVRVDVAGPHWAVRDIDLWQDNFPEEGGIGPMDYARCDMAQSILPNDHAGILPGDSLRVVVSDPAGLAADNTGGRPGKAVYVFVRVTDRFENPVAGTNGVAIQSPDNVAYQTAAGTDPFAGTLRWPHVPGVAPAGWDAYRMDQVFTTTGEEVKDAYCVDLMDLGSGPTGPHYNHANENSAANTGIFTAGDVIHYFFAAKNTNDQWSYWHRTGGYANVPVYLHVQLAGQGTGRRTDNVAEATGSPCEWSVLPDAGREPYPSGTLFVDDADDRIVVNDIRTLGSPAEIYMDWAFTHIGITSRIDRFDVLGPSSCVGNSLASRVKNVTAQLIGASSDVYRQILWSSSDLSRGLMGDGGWPNGGSSAEKSDDFALCYAFLDNHPHNPGWAYWGDDVVEDWNSLDGTGAADVVATFMNHTLTSGDQRIISGVVSPVVRCSTSPAPVSPWFVPVENFYAFGGCPMISDFDVPGQSGNSRIAQRYDNSASGPVASLSQVTVNSRGTNARFFLAGYAYDFIRDDDLNGIPDRVPHLREVLVWFQNIIPMSVGIEPVAFNDLRPNFPNPFNPTTTIEYSIAQAGRVTLRIYNAAGQLVRTLVDEEQSPQAEGFTSVWDGFGNRGEEVASGVYFYKLTAKEFTQTRKMVLLK